MSGRELFYWEYIAEDKIFYFYISHQNKKSRVCTAVRCLILPVYARDPEVVLGRKNVGVPTNFYEIFVILYTVKVKISAATTREHFPMPN